MIDLILLMVILLFLASNLIWAKVYFTQTRIINFYRTRVKNLNDLLAECIDKSLGG